MAYNPLDDPNSPEYMEAADAAWSNTYGSGEIYLSDPVSSALYNDYSAAQLNDYYSDKYNAWAEEQTAKAYDYSASEAQKNRDWQEYMSNTAHQREVADLVAAGLNPVLSVNSGASTPSGSSASGVAATGKSATATNTANNVLASYLQSLIGSATTINAANISAKTNLQTASIYAAAEKYAAKYAADMSYQKEKDFPSNAWQFVGPYARQALDWLSNLLSNDSSSKSLRKLKEPDFSDKKSDVDNSTSNFKDHASYNSW